MREGWRDKKFVCDHLQNPRGEISALPLLLTTLSTNPSEDSQEYGFYPRDATSSRGGNATSENRTSSEEFSLLVSKTPTAPSTRPRGPQSLRWTISLGNVDFRKFLMDIDMQEIQQQNYEIRKALRVFPHVKITRMKTKFISEKSILP